MSRTMTAVLFGVSLLLVACQADAKSRLALGAAPPLSDVEMTNVDGKQLAVVDVKGAKGTLVIFTCNHCPYVKAWDERITALGNEFVGKGIGVIAINSNDPSRYEEDGFETMKRRSKDLGQRFGYVVDSGSRLAQAYGASKTPEVFLFDAANALVYHGAIDDNYSDATGVTKRFLRDALEAVIAGRAVPLAETKALGCSIKMQG